MTKERQDMIINIAVMVLAIGNLFVEPIVAMKVWVWHLAPALQTSAHGSYLAWLFIVNAARSVIVMPHPAKAKATPKPEPEENLIPVLARSMILFVTFLIAWLLTRPF